MRRLHASGLQLDNDVSQSTDEPYANSTMVTRPVRECLQAGTEDAPVLDHPLPLRRLHDSGAGYKYPELLTYNNVPLLQQQKCPSVTFYIPRANKHNSTHCWQKCNLCSCWDVLCKRVCLKEEAINEDIVNMFDKNYEGFHYYTIYQGNCYALTASI